MDWSKCSKFLVPKWTANGKNGLESFISELRTAKTMGILPTDKMLIYASMVKSNRSEILETLTNEQMNNLENFIGYLRSSFGPSQQEKRFGFQRLKQEEDEDSANFFIRTEKMYFQSKNMRKPNGEAFLNDYKEDIRFQFIQGLRNPEVKRLMYLNGSSVDYTEIGLTARNYSVSLKDLGTTYTVNSITDTEEDPGETERRSRSRERRPRCRNRNYH